MHHHLTIYGIREPTPGPRWQALFDATWPAYRGWYLGQGDAARPSRNAARRALREHMPELMPTFEKLVELARRDPLAERMLTLWNAPGFLPACSQAAVPGGPEPALVRNYDYSPDLWERTIVSTRYGTRKVIGTGDCLWGLLDGMNDAGLAISLAFGGRPGAGDGFAIPIVLRYLLETADSVQQARESLQRLPVAMSYNLTMVDARGDGGTAFVAPGQPPEFRDELVATNHRSRTPEFHQRAEALNSVPRQRALESAVRDANEKAREQGADETGVNEIDDIVDALLTTPLYNRSYSRSFGTLYTAAYRPAEGTVDYHWPNLTWRRRFDDPDATRTVVLDETVTSAVVDDARMGRDS
jgi:predicted choloylglycine hydrolase